MNSGRRTIGVAVAMAAVLLLGATAARAAVPNGAGARSRAPARAMFRLQIQGAPRALVVGQAVPVIIRADFLGGTGVTLNGVPRLVSDGFTLSGVADKPRQTEVQLDGLPYTELTWTGALTAIQAGAPPAAVELPVELTYRDAQARPLPDATDQDQPSPFASLFANTPLASDPFFAQMLKDDPFSRMFQDLGGAVRQREVTLRDQARHLTVTPPPQPAPAGFAGAVGSFRANSSLSAGPFRVGEPVTLTVRVDGQGSFDRLSTAGVPASETLSTYPPRAAFTTGSTPTAGTKVFTQTLVPRRSGALEVPAVTLVSFDPQRHRYVTERTRPFSLSVAAAAEGEPAAPPQPVLSPAAAAPRSPSLLDSRPRALVPAIHQPWFWWVPAALAGAGLLASAAATPRVRRRLAGARADRARRRLVLRARRRMDAAVAAGDAPALFGAARAGLQACLARAWSIPADAISAADVQRRLGERGAGVLEIFQRADRVAYGGGRSPVADLNHWRQIAGRELDGLKEVA